MTENWLTRVSDEEGMLENLERLKRSCKIEKLLQVREWEGEDVVLMIQAQRTFRICQGRLVAMKLIPPASFGA